MDGSVPTIRIVDEDVPGGRLINTADFDEAVHTRFEAEAPAPKTTATRGGKKAGAKTDPE